MEFVSSVSAILGIVGIAAQALDGIVKLRGFFQDYSQASEKCGRFVRELSSLVQVIAEAKGLLGKLQSGHGGYIAGNIEFCSNFYIHYSQWI